MAIIESKQHWHRRATDQQETLDCLGPRQLTGGMRAGEFGDGQAFETEDCVYLLSRVWGEQRGAAAAVGSRP